MVVEVGPEIEQLVFEVCRRPEQSVIQVLASNGAVSLCRLQYAQIGFPLVEPIKRIVVGADVLRHPALPSNGAVEHQSATPLSVPAWTPNPMMRRVY